MIEHRCISYDASADAMYIGLAFEYAGVPRTFSAPGEGILVDVVDGKLVGLEILDASNHPIFGQLVPKAYGVTLNDFTTCAPDTPHRMRNGESIT